MPAKRKSKGGLGTGALGKGAGSNVAVLFPHVDALREQGETLREVATGWIKRSKWQPRLELDPETLKALARSIKAHGVLEPLLVRPLEGDRYELLAGERRLAAARKARLRAVPVRVLDVDDASGRAITLTENLAREDLAPWEEAWGLAALRNVLEETGEKVTRDRLAELTGRSGGSVSESLSIADRLTAEVLVAVGTDGRTLTGLPKLALYNASRPEGIADRAELLAYALWAREELGQAPGKATKKRRGGRPQRPYTLTIRDGRGVSLTLRRPPEELEPEDARKLVARLRPVWRSLTKRAKE